jgi:hypothetical protein
MTEWFGVMLGKLLMRRLTTVVANKQAVDRVEGSKSIEECPRP